MSALAGGFMFYRLWRIAENDRVRVWRLYGWFSALMMCGSCVGVVTWVAWMMTLVHAYYGTDRMSNQNVAEGCSYFALAFSW